MGTLQYSADTVDIAWLGLDFGEGVAVGTFIQQTRGAPNFTKKPRGKGGIVRVFNPDQSGSLAIIVDQESQLHQQLIAVAELDRRAATRSQIGEMVLTDTASGFVGKFKNTYIASSADEARGTDSGTFTWLFEYEEANPEPVDTPENVVGT